MKMKLLIMTAILIFANLTICQAQTKDALHTPKKGSAERRAILKALQRGAADVKFQVNFLKVHNGWAWIDATPLDERGRATAEGGPSLLNLKENNWTLMDLSIVPDDPNNPMGAMDISKAYIANLQKTFSGVPLDIFPKPRF